MLFVGRVRHNDGIRGECGEGGSGGLNRGVTGDRVGHCSAVCGAEGVLAEVGGGLLVGDWSRLFGFRLLGLAGPLGFGGSGVVPSRGWEMPEGCCRRRGGAGAEGIAFVRVTGGGGSQVGR